MKGEISYVYLPGKIYLNITNRCSNSCDFCVRNYTDELCGNYLWLEEEPDVDEILSSIKLKADKNEPDEIVFCGYGEPMFRPYIILSVLEKLKNLYSNTKYRINTNGQSALINKGKTFLNELSAFLDSISISLNAHNSMIYEKTCKPLYGKDSFNAVLAFAREAVNYIPDVTLTVVSGTSADIEKCRNIAKNIGAKFRIRQLLTEGR